MPGPINTNKPSAVGGQEQSAPSIRERLSATWNSLVSSIKSAPSTLFSAISNSRIAISFTSLFSRNVVTNTPTETPASQETRTLLQNDLNLEPEYQPTSAMIDGKSIRIPARFYADFNRANFFILDSNGNKQRVPGTGPQTDSKAIEEPIEQRFQNTLQALYNHVNGNVPMLERLMACLNQDPVVSLKAFSDAVNPTLIDDSYASIMRGSDSTNYTIGKCTPGVPLEVTANWECKFDQTADEKPLDSDASFQRSTISAHVSENSTTLSTASTVLQLRRPRP